MGWADLVAPGLRGASGAKQTERRGVISLSSKDQAIDNTILSTDGPTKQELLSKTFKIPSVSLFSLDLDFYICKIRRNHPNISNNLTVILMASFSFKMPYFGSIEGIEEYEVVMAYNSVYHSHGNCFGRASECFYHALVSLQILNHRLQWTMHFNHKKRLASSQIEICLWFGNSLQLLYEN